MAAGDAGDRRQLDHRSRPRPRPGVAQRIQRRPASSSQRVRCLLGHLDAHRRHRRGANRSRGHRERGDPEPSGIRQPRERTSPSRRMAHWTSTPSTSTRAKGRSTSKEPWRCGARAVGRGRRPWIDHQQIEATADFTLIEEDPWISTSKPSNPATVGKTASAWTNSERIRGSGTFGFVEQDENATVAINGTVTISTSGAGWRARPPSTWTVILTGDVEGTFGIARHRNDAGR